MQKRIVKLVILLLIIGITRINTTNASFTSQQTVSGNHVSTGWWVMPTVTVISPNGGEIWSVGSTHNITWSAVSADPAGTITNINILLSTDSGATYPTTLVSGLPNTGIYSWTIGDPKSAAMKVKIVATDNHGLIGFDESDAVFDPVIEVYSKPVPTPTTTPTPAATPTASLVLSSDRKTISFGLDNVSAYTKLNYTITYDAYTITRGIGPSDVTLDRKNEYSSQNFDLATCSSGVCSYDQDVHNFQLQITLSDTKGDTTLLNQKL